MSQMETFPSLPPAARRILPSFLQEKSTQSTESVWNFRAPRGFSLLSLLRENSLTVLSQHPTAAKLGLPTLRDTESQIAMKIEECNLHFRSTHLIATAEAPSEGMSLDADKTNSVSMLKDTTFPAAPEATPRQGVDRVKSIDRGVISSILTELKN